MARKILLFCASCSFLLAVLWQIVLPSSWTPLGAGDELYGQIAQFYDHSTEIWEKTWGDHLHSGWYEENVDTSAWSQQDHVNAQIVMMRKLLALADLSGHTQTTFRVLDMGCGLGGSSRFLYRELTKKLPPTVKVEVTGITLSPWQQQRATAITNSADDIANESVRFYVRNALSTEFPADTFDIVWSLESAEHFPSKELWLSEVRRILVPGGTLLCATWCQRSTAEDSPLSTSEATLLGRISKNYALPAWVSLADYGELAAKLQLEGFGNSQRSWTINVLPFWPAVIWSAMRPSIMAYVLSTLPFSGWTTIKGAVTAILMMQGFRSGTLDFGVFAVKKQS